MHPSTRAAVVTASDSGLGRAIALTLADDRFHVGLAYTNDRRSAENTAAQVRTKSLGAAVRRLDPADLPDAVAVIDEFAGELGGIGVLVNCPGSMTVECIRRAVRYMIDSGGGGRIVNIRTSLPGPGGLTGQLATELARYAITVNAVVVPAAEPGSACPGRDDPAATSVVSYLTSPEAASVTGAAYVVDGARITIVPHGLAEVGSRRPAHNTERTHPHTGHRAPTRRTR
ncbi:short-chain dehydrogenase [Rhodococcus sp. WMMA185]|uniref:SDR family NAD(P)-dependent oxidoreductase n=1 Tax=Rhodococcus sp. WMMA185 TaxID=679318 RepID=UPI0008784FD9|nr:SDR family NAD(P)-dependent oxidoreductase [Rhodococcus sp. WMMA185]AOW92663.1 short-chain dehydrogenase [Rhodococcus sp. WMMA185]